MNSAKVSIRFFDDREVRTVWDEQNSKWWFSVLDILTKLKKEKSELVSATTQLKLLAHDGEKRLSWPIIEHNTQLEKY